MNEIRMMREINHENIINLREVYETDNSLYMVMDLINGGQLLSILKPGKKLPISLCKHILKQILSAVDHIHSKNIMHRDIKPQNILIKDKESFEINLVDFGLSTKCDLKNFIFVRCGTPGFVAPEIMKIKDGDAIYDKACDIFSIGIILHIM